MPRPSFDAQSWILVKEIVRYWILVVVEKIGSGGQEDWWRREDEEEEVCEFVGGCTYHFLSKSTRRERLRLQLN